MFAAPLVLATHLASAQPAQLELGGRALARPAVREKIGRVRPIGARPAPIPVGNRPVVVPVAGAGTPPSAVIGGPADATALQKAYLGATDDDLIAFFRKRTPPAPPKESILALVAKLGEKDTAAADKAEGELNAIGPAAVPALQTAANDTDRGEGAIRARRCLAAQGPAAANLVTQAARLLASRKPAAAAEVLLAYSPFAEDDAVLAEIELALRAVAVRDGRADSAVLKALADPVALRRAAAADALCKAGGTAFHAELRPLLKDDLPSVRLRVALGLVGVYDAEAVPVLIELLAQLAPAQRRPVEELLIGLAGVWGVAGPKGDDALSNRLRRDVWAAWWKNVDGPSLLAEVKGRTLSNADRRKLLGLLAKLGDDDAETREAATKEILAMGRRAGPMLRQAAGGGESRACAFAAKCLEAIDKDDGALPSATPRLLALRRPEGTIPALVAYLPFAESPPMRSQIVEILAAIGCPAGRADPALVDALGDDLAIRRSCAAEALCRARATAQLPALKKLLADEDRQVVLRVARGLASMGQKESIPALIGLLGDLPIEQAWDVEEFLDLIAGEKAPAVSLVADAAGRAKAVEAWKKWWRENEKTTDLAKIDLARREAGVYLVAEGYNPMLGTAGRILEVDAAGKQRWEVRNLIYPNDVQLLRNGNLLVVEQRNRVTERDRTGKVVGLNMNFNQVIHAERLRNGNTFLACQNQLLILDPKGAIVLDHTHNAGPILAGRHFRDGRMAFLTYTGQYVTLDSAGRQLESRNLAWVNSSFSGASISADGKVLVADNGRHLVIEYGKDGRQDWTVSVPAPLTPVRSAGGNILVPCNSSTAIHEIDPNGRLVKKWEGFAFRPVKVTRR